MGKASGSKEPVEVFYSYAHEDERLRDKLDRHLSTLKNNGVITGWHDREILAGRDWEKEIDEHLDTAKVILLLISEYFLASTYCYGIEMERALQRDAAGEARVIPVILRDVYWENAPFGKLQALPKDAKAIMSWRNRERAFKNVAEGIARAIEEIQATHPADSTPTRPGGGTAPGQKRIWNVPHRRNPNFTGREELLAELRKQLTSGKRAALTQAVYGLGGVGKTQLATEYAYRHAGDYDVVWWVRSEEAATLAADYAGLASKLGLPEAKAREQEVIVEAVRNWLEGKQRWLLVFDNANGPEEVNRYLPRVVNGHVIITSRNPIWGEIASPLQVKVLEPDEGAKFLLTRTRQEDEESARKLSEALGGLPLALAQAGAYIEANGVAIAHYLKLFQPKRRELWGEEEGPLDYDKRTVGTTLSLAIKQVEAKAPASMDMLHLCAFLGPDDIPRSMLSEGKDHLPEQLRETVADELKMNRAIEALRRYSLVDVDMDKSSLSVHRLVQAVERDRLGEDESKVWAEAALDVVNKAFPQESEDVRTWVECARLLPHALATTGYIEGLTVRIGSAGRLLNQIGTYLIGRAQYVEAKSALERSLSILSKVYGLEHSRYATALSNLGLVLQDLGDLEGAKTHFEKALAINEKELGPNHPVVAVRVNNLGGVLKDLGNLEGAKTHFERALAIDEKELGPAHHDVATLINNLGVIFQELGDLEGAKTHFERALTIDEKVFGPNHPQVGIDVNNLGRVLQDLGDLEGAKTHFERALAIDEKVFGSDHPDVALHANNLGMVLQDLGDLQGAKMQYRRALRIFHQFLGEAHPKSLTVRRNLEVAMNLLATRASGGE